MTKGEITKALLEARDLLTNTVKRELMGPGSEVDYPDAEHELISESPQNRYSTGILYPRKKQRSDDNDGVVVTGETDADAESEKAEIARETCDEIIESKIEETFRYSETEGEFIPEKGDSDQDVTLARQNLPSSMGVTFFVNSGVKKINISISYAEYMNIPASKFKDELVFKYDGEKPFIPDDLASVVSYDVEKKELTLLNPLKKKELDEIFKRGKNDGCILYDLLLNLSRFKYGAYRRNPCFETIILELTDYAPQKKMFSNHRLSLTAVQRKINDAVDAVTVMLSNETETSYFFQPRIDITADKECGTTFVSKNELVGTVSTSEEDSSLNMLYRKRLSYATGHGVSTEWTINENGYGTITTSYIPTSEVPRVKFDLRRNTAKEKAVDDKCLSMKYLSDLDYVPKDEKIAKMIAFVDTFDDWIDGLENEAETIGEKSSKAAERHIAACRESYCRMKDGLKLLQENDVAWKSFSLANRAMFMQRIHGGFQKTERDIFPGDPDIRKKLATLDYAVAKDEHFWRPFQLAFLLMSVQSIVNTESPERDIVDLIWFPTGGGKTEAYLGLTAFTIFHRRLSKPEGSGGTAVFMRYTLRLLTSQQFTRAATLICACEAMRKDEPRLGLGNEEITIGLWIGGEHVPNRRKDAKDKLSKLSSSEEGGLDYRKDRFNKFQVLKCPWCGTKLTKELDGEKEIGQWGYIAKSNEFIIHCTQEGCKFEFRLPIKIIDEDIYEKPPTLLFGTVDKFAMLPWKAETGALFGLGLKTANRAPELIIQDELHLISGPLGSIVGIYETAIDWLSSFDGIKSKIIASTATICRAREQVGALYNRQVRQFPSPGLDASDSFFSTEEKLFDESGNRMTSGRLYCGIMPSGITKAMMQARLFAVTLQCVNRMAIPDEVKDLLWTETGYYNSLRDLGKASALIDDDVKDFIKRLAYRHNIYSDTHPRSIPKTYELTSRVPTTELLETLDKLEHLKYSKENFDAKKYAVSTLLASNMISVGVDIDRLNIMLIVGQPKLTSEYIQASSRIGRSFPGVAFTLYDAAKSRDRSYYEMFVPFHESFYKFVEPTGITPFSIPARQKALHAIIVSALRHTGADLSDEKSASNIDIIKHKAIIDKLKKFIKDRVKSINALNPVITDDSTAVEQEVIDFIDEWSYMAQSAPKEYLYGNRYIVQPPTNGDMRLLKPFNQGGTPAKNTLTSMRSVDESVKCGIIVWDTKAGK